MLSAAGPDTSLPVIDEAAMADWCCDLDKDDIAEILAQVPDQCSLCLVEIEAAVAASDLVKAKRVAHRMKGMAANLGATRLARFARSIEIESRTLDDVVLQLPTLNATVFDTIAAIQARN